MHRPQQIRSEPRHHLAWFVLDLHQVVDVRGGRRKTAVSLRPPFPAFSADLRFKRQRDSGVVLMVFDVRKQTRR